jgi:hypothetical protein
MFLACISPEAWEGYNVQHSVDFVETDINGYPSEYLITSRIVRSGGKEFRIQRRIYCPKEQRVEASTLIRDVKVMHTAELYSVAALSGEGEP